ncbi:MAG: hypothetical protein ILA02_03435 [Clostridia bacterium]|nr:hypothetical protein [Clostridia bacterium]
MELKTRYQYTYFIHTFLINQNRYNKYIAKLMKDNRFNLRIFRKENDLELYSYFLPRMRSFLFKTFEFNREKINKIEALPFETQCAILSEYPSLTFEYDLKKDLQGKTVDENSIFFKIQKVGIVCFNTGICFLYFKTNIEESEKFSDILNFNYKFRDINQECNNLKNYDNIRLQANYFEDIQQIKDFITDITGPNFDAMKINLNVERFYTYSYECIDQSAWNQNTDFESINNDFLRYIKILPNDKGMHVDENDSVKIISKDKFSKIGLSKLGVNLFSSDVDINNYTILPQEYENQYFYTYILALYLKVYLKKIDYDFKTGKNVEKARKDFIDFTKKLWIQEITSEDFGSLLYQDMREVLELEESYNKIKNKYDLLYRELKIEKTERMSIIIACILVVTLVFNILNWLNIL